MEKVVTTLPISVRKERKLTAMITPVVASFAAGYCGDNLSIALGTLGRGTSAEQQDINATSEAVRRLAPGATIVSDGTDSYRNFWQATAPQWLESGLLAHETVPMLGCECGVVYIERNAVEATPPEKLKYVTSQRGSYACRFCETTLVEESPDCLVTRPALFAPLSENDAFAAHVPQRSYHKKTADLLLEAASRRKVVTRPSRPNCPTISIGGREYFVDPDFWLQAMPAFTQLKEQRDVVVVAGSRQHGRLLGSLCLAKATVGDSSPMILMHPRLQTVGIDVFAERPAEVSPLALRLLVALSLKWNGEESSVGQNEVIMASKMADLLPRLGEDLDYTYEPSEDIGGFMRTFSTDSLRRVLKNIRRRQVSRHSPEAAVMKSLLVGY